MSLVQFRFSGFGGQGVIMMGMILGRAGAIHSNLNATLLQSFGPEARGGACSATVLLDTDPIYYPYVVMADVFVTMSQESFDKYITNLRKDGLLIYEEDLVTLDKAQEDAKIFSIPATKLAEELGRKMVANIVMTGFLTAIWDGVSASAMRTSALEVVPKGTEELNGIAFDKGYAYGLNQKAKG